MILRLENSIRNYAWGSRDGIANFLGRGASAQEPEAEMWIGAHPDDSSRVQFQDATVPLVDVIAASPQAMLGPEVAARFDGRLPYLLKVLAAGSPLSLQAHPTLEQARSGYDDEERRGIPQKAPHRNYRDRNHKPELIFATTRFEALCGFRPVGDIIRTFERLKQPSLLELAEGLRGSPDSSGLRLLVERLLLSEPRATQTLVEETRAAAERGQHVPGPEKRHLEWIVRLGHEYPGDVGVVTALLLNYVALEVGQAIFLQAKSLHSYLSGVGIEIMASSDNVLRGGLTPKHVDAGELLRVLSFEPMAPPIVVPTALTDQETAFLTPAADFRLSVLALDGGSAKVELTPVGPELLLCADGQIQATAPGQEPVDLTRGDSAFIAANSKTVSLAGTGRLFRATVGSLES